METFAQEALWNELSNKVAMLYQGGQYSDVEIIDLTKKGLKPSVFWKN